MTTQAPTQDATDTSIGDDQRGGDTLVEAIADTPVAAVDAGDGDATPAVVDGRKARRDRNAEAVLRAAVELLAEGQSHPPGQLIADRAGVSLRTIFRCFPSLDALMKVTIQEYIRTRPDCFVWVPPAEGASFTERVDHVVRAQSTMCRVAGKALRAGIDRAVLDPELQEFGRARREIVRDILRQVFTPELETRSPEEQALTLSRAHTAIFLESWEMATSLHGLTEDQATEAMRRSLTAAFTS